MEPDSIKPVFDEVVRFVRVSERLTGVVTEIGRLSETLSELCDLDPELGPELAAALEPMKETLAAIGRASTFIDARCLAALESLTA